MGRNYLARGFRNSLGGKKSSTKKKLISEFSGVSLTAPKLNKETSRQRKIKNTLGW